MQYLCTKSRCTSSELTRRVRGLVGIPLLTLILLAGSTTPALAGVAIDSHAEMLRSARMWEAKDRPDLARIILEKALVTKEDAEVLLLLSSLELRSNNTSLAAKYLQRLEQHYPQHPNTLAVRNLFRVYTTDKQTLARTRLLARSGKAEDAANAMLQLFPQGPPPEELGLEYFQIIGNTAQGKQAAISGLAKLYRETGEARYRLAWLRLVGGQSALQERLHDYEALAKTADVNKVKLREDWWSALKLVPTTSTSIPLVNHFLQEFPNDQKAIDLMVDLQQHKEFTDNQKSVEKVTLLKQHKIESPLLVKDPAILTREAGLAFLERGQLEEAERELQKALLVHPNDAETLGGIGLIRLRQGNQQEALTWFERAASMDNSKKWRSLIRTANFWNQMKRAEALMDAGKLQEAQDAAQQALAIDANNASCLALLGNILVQRDAPDEAERLYRKALKQDASSSAAMRGLLALLSRGGRRSEALTLIAEFRAKNPQDAEQFSSSQARILRDEADTYLLAHRPTDALQALETAVFLAPNDAWIRYDLASLYENLGQPSMAQRVMTEGAALMPDDPGMNYAYALVLTSQESEDEALLRLSRIPLAARTNAMNDLETRAKIKLGVRQAKLLFAEGKAEEVSHQMQLVEQYAAGKPNAIEQVTEAWFGLEQPARGLDFIRKSLIDTKIATSNNQLYYASLLNRAKQDKALSMLLPELSEHADWNDKQLEALLDIETDLSLRSIESLLKQGEKDKARAIATQMPVFGKAGEISTLKSQTRLLMEAREMKIAFPLLQTILEMQPDDLESRQNIARVYYNDGQTLAAQGAVKQLLESLPDNDLETRLSIARLQVKYNDIALARNLVAELLIKNPNNLDVLMQAGNIERSDKQYDAALKYYRQVKALAGSPAAVKDK
jgi:cellulose synthase operon protein C